MSSRLFVPANEADDGDASEQRAHGIEEDDEGHQGWGPEHARAMRREVLLAGSRFNLTEDPGTRRDEDAVPRPGAI